MKPVKEQAEDQVMVQDQVGLWALSWSQVANWVDAQLLEDLSETS